jgi:two-component sensor histidine kinase
VGLLKVTWAITDEPQASIELVWRESGVTGQIDGTRRGFGTELIQRQLAHVLDAQLHSEYHCTGLELRVRIPLDPTRVSVAAGAVVSGASGP